MILELCTTRDQQYDLMDFKTNINNLKVCRLLHISNYSVKTIDLHGKINSRIGLQKKIESLSFKRKNKSTNAMVQWLTRRWRNRLDYRTFVEILTNPFCSCNSDPPN